VTVLLDSLPTGAAITGPAEQTVTIGREQLEVDIAFLVSIEQRPEIRRVFPGGSGGRSEGAPRRKAPAARPGDGG
jgi:hypothetical protein